MKKIRTPQQKTTLLACLFAAVLSTSLAKNAQASILPPNELHLDDDIGRKDANLDESTFDAIIDRAVAHYEPLAREHGANLTVNRLWDNKMVNASALRVGPFWAVYMYGGLARRPEITADGFQLVMCHELGHLFAGYPFYRTIFGGLIWFSVEGESDYFASQSCARTLWRNDHEENSRHQFTVDLLAKQRCDMAWDTREQRNLCYRIAEASHSITRLLASIEKGAPKPRFDTPDFSSVKKTSRKHPRAQCRLDTYFEGALCTKDRNQSVIPGKFYAGFVGNLFNRKAERLAAEQSCHEAQGAVQGTRPRCWFAPAWHGEALF